MAVSHPSTALNQPVPAKRALPETHAMTHCEPNSAPVARGMLFCWSDAVSQVFPRTHDGQGPGGVQVLGVVCCFASLSHGYAGREA